MANLQVKEINNSLYEWLRLFAHSNNRSISQEVITILQEKATNVQMNSQNAVDEFLSLSGSWEDSRDENLIAEDICGARNNSSRFGVDNGLFD